MHEHAVEPMPQALATLLRVAKEENEARQAVSRANKALTEAIERAANARKEFDDWLDTSLSDV